MIEAVAKACNASLGLAFTAIGLFLMLLWTQAASASSESPLLSSDRQQNIVVKSLPPARINRTFQHNNESDCSTSNNKQCKYIVEDKIIQKRMKHRSNGRDNTSNNSNEPTVKSSKNLHERQVRSFEYNNKITKSKFPHDKNTFANYENGKTSFDFIRNISLDDKIMNNGESMENARHL